MLGFGLGVLDFDFRTSDFLRTSGFGLRIFPMAYTLLIAFRVGFDVKHFRTDRRERSLGTLRRHVSGSRRSRRTRIPAEDRCDPVRRGTPGREPELSQN